MLTSNKALLARFESLKNQLVDTGKEIKLRINEERYDNDCEVICEMSKNNYIVIKKEAYELLKKKGA